MRSPTKHAAAVNATCIWYAKSIRSGCGAYYVYTVRDTENMRLRLTLPVYGTQRVSDLVAVPTTRTLYISEVLLSNLYCWKEQECL